MTDRLGSRNRRSRLNCAPGRGGFAVSTSASSMIGCAVAALFIAGAMLIALRPRSFKPVRAHWSSTTPTVSRRRTN